MRRCSAVSDPLALRSHRLLICSPVHKLFRRASRFQPIADIAMRGQSRQLDYLDCCFDALVRTRYLLCMCATWLIVIGQDIDRGALEVLRIFVAPFAGTVRIACRWHIDCRERISILLPLDNKGRPLVGKRLDKLREPIENALHTIELPNPATSTIGSALPKVFRLEPQHLVQKRSALVGVIVCCNDTLLVPALA